jgi:amyloid beta precursor protein binding protein 1
LLVCIAGLHCSDWSKANSHPTAQSLTNPDSLILLYIAFLATDDFTATHLTDDPGSAANAPGEADAETDAEKITGIALKIIDDLINEAGTYVEDPEYSEVKSKAGEYVQEM